MQVFEPVQVEFTTRQVDRQAIFSPKKWTGRQADRFFACRQVLSTGQGAEPSNVTASSISIRWTAPMSNGGSRISFYLIEHHKKGEKKPDGLDFWVEAGKVRGSIYEYTVTGLTKGCEYLVRVRAINESGVGPERDAFPPTVDISASQLPPGRPQ